MRSRSGATTSMGCASLRLAPARTRRSVSMALDDGVETDFARALVRDGKLAPASPPLRVSRAGRGRFVS